MTGGSDPSTVVIDKQVHVRIDRLLPREARNQLLDDVLGVLGAADVHAFVVKALTGPGLTVGVAPGGRRAALRALAGLVGPGVHVQESFAGASGAQPVRTLGAEVLAGVPDHCDAVLVARFWSVGGGSLLYGLAYGVRIEFWTIDADDPQVVAAPVANAAAQHAHRDLLAPAEIELDGRVRPSIALFDRRLLPEITFPVDAVYTWVDGADPAWQQRMQRARAEAAGQEYHPEAHSLNRFVSRDELRYSLRSLEAYAPWIRRIFLVTDQQVPEWLDPSDDRVTVVDHRDVFTDPDVLPVFNSSAIISQLHHIDGLAEHYLYLNDDVFFGRDLGPEHFFLGSGVAKVFPNTLTRPFVPPASGDAPHLNITKNIRAAMERELGVSVSTAILHTPYPQLRSVNYEIEQRFAASLQHTAAQRFRHHLDIAQDQLFHYYAQATGRAVPVPPGEYTYTYANVAAAHTVHRLRHLLNGRGADTFCLNDAPEPGDQPMDDRDVAEFLAAYFPVPSRFER